MTILLGDPAPNFQNVYTTEGVIEDFYEWIGDSWVILFSHPKDFTPVCTTELGCMAQLKPEFDKRNTKLLALSVDSLESHDEWIKDIEEINNTVVNYPIIADFNRKVARLYDMIHPSEIDDLTIRSVYIIDPFKKVRLNITYPVSTGRNFNEILRVLDSLQVNTYKQLLTPANWNIGEDCIIPDSFSSIEANVLFGNVKTVKPYLRYTNLKDK